MLNPTELNEREGERGTAEPGEKTAPCSRWPQCHHDLLLGFKSPVCNSRGLEHEAPPWDGSMGWRAGTH